jgi:hypothetical protein
MRLPISDTCPTLILSSHIILHLYTVTLEEVPLPLPLDTWGLKQIQGPKSSPTSQAIQAISLELENGLGKATTGCQNYWF